MSPKILGNLLSLRLITGLVVFFRRAACWSALPLLLQKLN